MVTTSNQLSGRRRPNRALTSRLRILVVVTASASIWQLLGATATELATGRILGLVALVALLVTYATDSPRIGGTQEGSSNDQETHPSDRRLLDATRRINQSLDLEPVLDAVLSQARELLGARDGSLMLVHGTRELRVAAVIGDSAASGARRAFGEGIAGRVASRAEPSLIAGSVDLADRRMPPNAPPAPVSAISVPLLEEGRLIGVLNLNAKPNQSYSMADLRTLELLGEQAGYAIGNAQRFEAERLLSSRNRYLALHDPLTHLPNRAHFLDRLQRALQGRPGPGQIAVLYLDLDGFKPINDHFGHGVGDTLLRSVAERLRKALRATDQIARLGGDEFAVLLGRSSAPTALATAERLRQTVSQPFQIEGRRLTVQVSIGAALAESASSTGEELLRRADTAMQLAKASDSHRPALAEPTHRPAHSPLGLQIRQALANDRLQLRYQPLVDLDSGALRGLEALAYRRTRSGTWAQLEPLAPEDPALALAYDNWLIERAVTEISSLADPLLDLYLSIGSTTLADPCLADRLAQRCRQVGLAPGRIALQVTERIVENDLEPVAQQLSRLKAIGCKIVLDRFGSGEALSEPLHRLPVDHLKVDPIFVAGLAHDSGAAGLLQHLLGLQQALDLKIIACGVEHRQQAEQLLELGAHLATGSHFGAPLTLEQVARANAPQNLADQAS